MENVDTVLYQNQYTWNPVILLTITNMRHSYLIQLYTDNAQWEWTVSVTLF